MGRIIWTFSFTAGILGRKSYKKKKPSQVSISFFFLENFCGFFYTSRKSYNGEKSDSIELSELEFQ